MSKPKVTPRSVLRANESKKIPVPWKMEPRYTSSPWNLLSVLKRARI